MRRYTTPHRQPQPAHWWRYLRGLCCLCGLLAVQSQNVWGFDPNQQVEFRFTNQELTSVLERVSQLTGWSMVYDPSQVVGRVTVVTPGEIPLIEALRLIQEALSVDSNAIHVLVPEKGQIVTLEAALADVFIPIDRRKSLVLRNSNARGPQSRPYDCQPTYPYPMSPYWLDVIVEPKR